MGFLEGGTSFEIARDVQVEEGNNVSELSNLPAEGSACGDAFLEVLPQRRPPGLFDSAPQRMRRHPLRIVVIGRFCHQGDILLKCLKQLGC